MVAKVSPGTPATAKIPVTRSGWRSASSKAVFTPIDHPITTARSTPKWSITDSASSTNSSMPTRMGSSGRADPPVPRWFHETTRTPQSACSRAGQVQGLTPRPLHSRTVGPSMRPIGSFVHARRRVPSSLRMWWKPTTDSAGFGVVLLVLFPWAESEVGVVMGVIVLPGTLSPGRARRGCRGCGWRPRWRPSPPRRPPTGRASGTPGAPRCRPAPPRPAPGSSGC